MCYHRFAVAPLGNFGSPYSFFGPSFSQIGLYGFQLQHSFAPPNFGAPQFFGNMQQPHFANGTTPTPWMPYLPGPHFQNPAPPFGYQPTIPPNNGTTLQQQQIPPTANISQAWFPDSGASHHATNDPHNLLQSSTAAGNEHILMANGTGTRISSIGSNLFRSPYFPNTTLSLKNLLLVPSLTKNLLSVSKFTRDNNCFFEFHPSYCCVKSQDSHKVLLQGALGEDGLYKLYPSLARTTSHNNSTHSSASVHNSLLSPKEIHNTVVSSSFKL